MPRKLLASVAKVEAQKPRKARYFVWTEYIFFRAVLVTTFILCVTAAVLVKRSNIPGSKPAPLTRDYLTERSKQLNLRNGSFIFPIMRPRQVGTESHDLVAEFISKTLVGMNWSVFHDSFVDKGTPLGPMAFRNIVAISHLHASEYIVLAAHYDSKLLPDFIGASDSAAPCSILMAVASAITALHKLTPTAKVGVQIIFFDGEEAFKEWTTDDSLYGSRHLASLYKSQGPPISADELGLKSLDPNLSAVKSNAFLLPSLRLFVLLDLLGCSEPFVPVYSEATRHYYDLLRSFSISTKISWQPYSKSPMIEDDHLPWMKAGVPILHLIPTPFPKVWHTESDTLENLDEDTIFEWADVILLFVLHLLERRRAK